MTIPWGVMWMIYGVVLTLAFFPIIIGLVNVP